VKVLTGSRSGPIFGNGMNFKSAVAAGLINVGSISFAAPLN